MRIAVIGAGNVGNTLGQAWRRRGHRIFYGVRDPDNDRHRRLGSPAMTNERAVGEAGVVALCTPWQHTHSAIEACGDLRGKIVIDCTNPLTTDFTALEVGHTTSGAEQIALWAPGARVCKGMNQIGAPMMDATDHLSAPPVMFICGDDAEAKDTAGQLIGDLGFEVRDAGDLNVARLLEPLALLWIHMALTRGMGTNWAFGVLSPSG